MLFIILLFHQKNTHQNTRRERVAIALVKKMIVQKMQDGGERSKN
jgi:hypothetical protein